MVRPDQRTATEVPKPDGNFHRTAKGAQIDPPLEVGGEESSTSHLPHNRVGMWVKSSADPSDYRGSEMRNPFGLGAGNSSHPPDAPEPQDPLTFDDMLRAEECVIRRINRRSRPWI